MKATVLVDNISTGTLGKEWGLSIFVEYGDKTVLLDTGASALFLQNAGELGLPIDRVDYGVLSHAHYDHADGMAAFFRENRKASFYLRAGSGENCYGKKGLFLSYIGIKKGTLASCRDRIVYVDGDYELAPGILLIPHKTAGLAKIGKQNGMYVRQGIFWRPDDFSHEQSLVFDTEKGLVIFNSCCHGGADHIIGEVAETCPGKQIYAIVGGLHLYQTPEAEVRALADRIRATGISRVYTGHCTGKRAFQILKEELKDGVTQLETGLVMEF